MLRFTLSLTVVCGVIALAAAPAQAANANLQIVSGKWVLSADTTLSGGNPRPQTLTVTYLANGGAADADQYSFHVESADADADNVIPSGFTPGQHACAYASGNTDTTTFVCKLRNANTSVDVTNLRLQGGEGSDSLTVFGAATNPRNGVLRVTAPVELVGNGGIDRLESASLGTPGVHDGGAGDDQYLGSHFGADSFNDTGGGTDRVNYANATSPVNVSIDNVANDGLQPAGISEGDNVAFGIEDVFGGPAADTLVGNFAPNLLSGEAGADTLRGGDAADVLDGKVGDDVLDGGFGPDIFNGGDGTDTADYSTRARHMTVSLDNTAIDGSVGGTSIEDRDNLSGPADNVKDDVENVRAGPGGMTVSATAAGTVNNVLEGGTGTDTFFGGAGNDRLLDGGGSGDRFDGGDGIDRADYSSSTSNVTVSLADGDPTDGAAGENDDIEVNVEQVIGGAGDDLIIGNAEANAADGGAGDDTYRLGAGDDSTALGGLLGADPGFDTLDYSDHAGPVTVELGSGIGGAAGEADGVGVNVERIIGTAAGDTLRGDSLSPDDEVFRGGAGDDTIEGRGGMDLSDYSERSASVSFSLDGQDNDGVGGEEDILSTIEGAIGGAAADTLTGDASANTFTGGPGTDTVSGGAGDDTVLVRDDEADSVSCGSESDAVVADLVDSVDADCESVDKPPVPPADPPTGGDPPPGDTPAADPPADDPPAAGPADGAVPPEPEPDASPPSNSFRLGRTTGLRRGFARLAAIVPGPGQVVARARARARLPRFRVVRATATEAGRVLLTIRPTGKAKRALARTGRLKVRIKVTFTPTGGTAASRTITVTLRRL